MYINVTKVPTNEYIPQGRIPNFDLAQTFSKFAFKTVPTPLPSPFRTQKELFRSSKI